MYRILLVENNLIYRRVLKSALLKRFDGIEITEASDESSALNIVNSLEPELIIMDIALNTGLNGLDLTKIIKAEYPQTVVIILSENDIPEYHDVAQQNGADYFFSKSASLESILDYVTSAIGYKSKAWFRSY